jgi:hypothetical protein
MAGQTTNYLFDYPTSTDYVKDGATAIETLADDVDATLFTALGGNYPGLRLIKKQTIGTTVGSVVVTAAFNSTYDNYKVIVSGGTCTANANMSMILGASTASYFGAVQFTDWATNANSSGTHNNTANFAFMGNCSPDNINVDLDVLNPNLNKFTGIHGMYLSAINSGTTSGLHKVATAYTGFTLTPAAGTLTGGTIYVYGYGAS